MTLLIANLVGVRLRARESAKKAELNQFKKALRMYYNDNQSYPSSTSTADGRKIEVNSSTLLPGDEFSDGGNVYIQEVPEYEEYTVDGDGDRFVMYIVLDNASDKDIAASKSKCGYYNTTDFPALSIDPTGTGNYYVVCAD